ncbi:MAG: cbb3-type cytochrome c oxidase N-terminal domain-containing protein [Bacteroidia bacterium]|jgi:cytochrome c oxidase cbb3-type subunit 3
MKKIFALLCLLAGFSAMAQNATAAQPIVSFQNLLIAIIVVLTVVMLMVVYVLQQTVNLLKNETLHGKPAPEDHLTFWEKMLALKPLSAEKDIELDHDFDGIKELNNPIPPWFNVLFYGTIIFAFGYLIVYHVIGSAPLQAQEYENQMAEAKIAKELFVKQSGNLVDESNVVLLTDATKLNAGKEVFMTKCAICHGEKGEGKVGPNLTDIYWLHGGKVQDLFKTIKYGVPAKGMVAWENSLNGSQIQELASYILTLQGTNPPGAKAAQGDAAVAEVPVAAAIDSTVKQ